MQFCDLFPVLFPGAGRDTPISEINLRHQNLLILRCVFSPLCCIFPILSPSVPLHVVDPAHIGQLGTQRLGKSGECPATFWGVATPGQARTIASSPQKPQIALLSFCGHSLVGAMPAAGYLSETLGNLAETTLSPKASVSAAICCALLHSEPTISEIRAVFVALPNHGFRANRAAYLQHRFPVSDYVSVFVAFFCACVTVNQCMTLRTVPPERVSMPG